MQPPACQHLPRIIEEEKIERRIIYGITLATAWLAPRLAQNLPAEIRVIVSFAGGLGTLQD